MKFAALAALSLGCQAAQAQAPTPTPLLERAVTVPPRWTTLDPGASDGAALRAWGDPGRGCYAVAAYAAVARQNPEDALAGFARVLTAEAALADWSMTGLDGRGRLTRGALVGEVRARAVPLGAGAGVVALACVHNPRAPEACAAVCAPLVASFDPAKVVAEVAP